MDGDRQDKEQYFIQPRIGMAFPIGTHQPMHMGDQLIDEIQAERTGEDARHRDQDRIFPAALQRGQNQPDHRRRQHHPRRKGKNDIRKFAGKIAKEKTQNRA